MCSSGVGEGIGQLTGSLLARWTRGGRELLSRRDGREAEVSTSVMYTGAKL